MAPVRTVATCTGGRPLRAKRNPGLSPEMIKLLRGKSISSKRRAKTLTPTVRTVLKTALEQLAKEPIALTLPEAANGRSLLENELYKKCKHELWCVRRPVQKRDITDWLKRQPFVQMVNEILVKKAMGGSATSVPNQDPVTNETSQEASSSVVNQNVTGQQIEDKPHTSNQPCQKQDGNTKERQGRQSGRSSELAMLSNVCTTDSPASPDGVDLGKLDEATQAIPSAELESSVPIIPTERYLDIYTVVRDKAIESMNGRRRRG